jgi:hypothetical protein
MQRLEKKELEEMYFGLGCATLNPGRSLVPFVREGNPFGTFPGPTS